MRVADEQAHGRAVAAAKASLGNVARFTDGTSRDARIGAEVERPGPGLFDATGPDLAVKEVAGREQHGAEATGGDDPRARTHREKAAPPALDRQFDEEMGGDSKPE